jgi:hypothetical protein
MATSDPRDGMDAYTQYSATLPDLHDRAAYLATAKALLQIHKASIERELGKLIDAAAVAAMPQYATHLRQAILSAKTAILDTLDAAESPVFQYAAVMLEQIYNQGHATLDQFRLYKDPGYGAGSIANKITLVDPFSTLVVCGDEAMMLAGPPSVLETPAVETQVHGRRHAKSSPPPSATNDQRNVPPPAATPPTATTTPPTTDKRPKKRKTKDTNAS